MVIALYTTDAGECLDRVGSFLLLRPIELRVLLSSQLVLPPRSFG